MKLLKDAKDAAARKAKQLKDAALKKAKLLKDAKDAAKHKAKQIKDAAAKAAELAAEAAAKAKAAKEAVTRQLKQLEGMIPKVSVSSIASDVTLCSAKLAFTVSVSRVIACCM